MFAVFVSVLASVVDDDTNCRRCFLLRQDGTRLAGPSGDIDTSVTKDFPTVNDDLPQILLVAKNHVDAAINADQVEFVKNILTDGG